MVKPEDTLENILNDLKCNKEDLIILFSDKTT